MSFILVSLLKDDTRLLFLGLISLGKFEDVIESHFHTDKLVSAVHKYSSIIFSDSFIFL